MRGNRILAAALLACLASAVLWAQHPPADQKFQAPNKQQKNSARAKNSPPVPRLGDWLRAHKDQPPDQQQKALESDPGFKKLPPQQQQALRNRLRWFNSLTPEQKERAIPRIDFLANLTPQQRQQIRQSNRELQTLPEERRVMVHKALRHLRQMDPQQRAEVMDSDRFKQTFSPQEQGILRELAAINPPNGGGALPGNNPQPK